MENTIHLKALRAVGYRRVSMREQVDGYSLDAQENSITKYIREQGWQLVDIYQDAGISAKKGSHRPAFEKLLQDASDGKFDVVVVDKVDRFYRHLSGLLSTLDQLNSCGVAFASVQERMDFTTPWGKLMLSVLGTLAEIYIDNLRQEVRKGKLQRARQGLWIGAIPYGYCNGLCSKCTDPNGKGYCPDFGQPDKSDGKKMVAHPIESKIVTQIFNWYATENETHRTIAMKLNSLKVTLADGTELPMRQKGVPGRTGPHSFSRDVIRDMLKRIAYTGKVAYQGVDNNGVHQKRKAPSHLFESVHPALVSQELFDQVNDIREIRFKNIFNRRGTPVRIFPLTGILRCGYCGGPMRGSSHANKRYYADGNQREKTCECHQPNVNADEIEQQVLIWIKDIVENVVSTEELDTEFRARQLEARFERVKKLYLLGELDAKTLEQEQKKLDEDSDPLHLKAMRSKIELVNDIQLVLKNWNDLSQLKHKKLFRLVLERAFVRQNAFTAGQPSFAFQPLQQSRSLGPEPCNSGEGGIRTRDRVTPALT